MRDNWQLKLSNFRTAEGRYYLAHDVRVLKEKLIQDLENFASGDGEIDGSEDLSLDGVWVLMRIINKRFGMDD